MCNPVESEECKDVTKDVCKIRWEAPLNTFPIIFAFNVWQPPGMRSWRDKSARLKHRSSVRWFLRSNVNLWVFSFFKLLQVSCLVSRWQPLNARSSWASAARRSVERSRTRSAASRPRSSKCQRSRSNWFVFYSLQHFVMFYCDRWANARMCRRLSANCATSWSRWLRTPQSAGRSSIQWYSSIKSIQPPSENITSTFEQNIVNLRCFRDDFEEQCDFVDVEVPDIECKEVCILNILHVTSKSQYPPIQTVHKMDQCWQQIHPQTYLQALQKECRPVTKKIETETWVKFTTNCLLNGVLFKTLCPGGGL